MENLIHILNEASKAYYNGESTMTDIEYDKLFDEASYSSHHDIGSHHGDWHD